MPSWLSHACANAGNGNQGAKGDPFKGNVSELNYCRSFNPVCEEDPKQPWYKLPDPVSPATKSPVRAGDVEGRCSGDWTSGMIVDQVGIPADVPPGDYVVGFRWDCEEVSCCARASELAHTHGWASHGLIRSVRRQAGLSVALSSAQLSSAQLSSAQLSSARRACSFFNLFLAAAVSLRLVCAWLVDRLHKCGALARTSSSPSE
jgi:hypothetical protein